MPRKDNNNNGRWRQLDLFEKIHAPSIKDTPQNNIVSIKTKMIDAAYKHEKESRNESINRLIEYAKKLNW